MKKLILIALIAPSLWGMPSKKRKLNDITKTPAPLTGFQEFIKNNEKISQRYRSNNRPGKITPEGVAYLSSKYFPAELDYTIAQDYFDALDFDPLIFDVNDDILIPTVTYKHAHGVFTLTRSPDGTSIHLACNVPTGCQIKKNILSRYAFYRNPSSSINKLRNPQALEIAWSKVTKQFDDISYLIKNNNNELITTHTSNRERVWSLTPLYILRERVKKRLSLHLTMLLHYTKVQRQTIAPELQADQDFLNRILQETAAEYRAEIVAFQEADTQPLNTPTTP